MYLQKYTNTLLLSRHHWHFTYLSAHLSLLSLFSEAPMQSSVNVSVTGEKEGGMGGSDTLHGEYFCSSFHYLALSFPGSPLYPRRKNILISVTATHTYTTFCDTSLSLPTSSHPPIHPSIHPLSLPLTAEEKKVREEKCTLKMQNTRWYCE